MSLVTIINVSLHFPGKQIFNGIGFQVEPTDRIGLVGPNGSGKTTLLRLIKGEIPADSGEVRMAKGIRIGYLPQDVQEVASGSLLESVLEAVPGRKELQRERSRLEQDLNRTSDKKAQERLAEKLAEVHQGIHEQDTAFPPHEAEKILLGLGFAPSDFTSSVSSFSGGWKMRAVLASLLYQKPDLLLLDEPTNHLDIPSVRWLDKFLHDFRGALILVSHDRDFLNRHVGRIISFEPEGVRLYTGNY
ncbi:MAG: ABC transporter ATP-binding protein, partial [Thermoplasmata archaeon]